MKLFAVTSILFTPLLSFSASTPDWPKTLRCSVFDASGKAVARESGEIRPDQELIIYQNTSLVYSAGLVSFPYPDGSVKVKLALRITKDGQSIAESVVHYTSSEWNTAQLSATEIFPSMSCGI